MTDHSPTEVARRRPPESTTRKPSAKTLARSLAAYLKANNIKGDTPVAGLMDRLKSSIVEQEVGSSLDVWES